MRIPFFRYPHVFSQHRELLERVFVDTASRGAFILQEEVAELERRIADYSGVRHAVAVANATDGLELIATAAGIGPGDEVILPSHTFVASASAIVTRGGTPVFAEIGDDHLLDPSDIEHRITPRTKAIMPAQLNGRTAAMDQLLKLAGSSDLLIIEDSAQGLGSRYKGRMAGSFGTGGVYSFYPAKTLGALGDGGIVVTNDPQIADEIRLRRDHGRDPQTGEVTRWGRNSRLDNLQAAVLLVKLDMFDQEIAFRRRIARSYNDRLQDVAQLHLPPAPEDGDDPTHFDVYQNYEIEAQDRDGLRAYLASKGIGTLIQWGGKGIHQFKALEIAQDLPRTEEMFRCCLMLPMNSSLASGEVDYICDCIREYY